MSSSPSCSSTVYPLLCVRIRSPSGRSAARSPPGSWRRSRAACSAAPDSRPARPARRRRPVRGAVSSKAASTARCRAAAMGRGPAGSSTRRGPRMRNRVPDMTRQYWTRTWPGQFHNGVTLSPDVAGRCWWRGVARSAHSRRAPPPVRRGRAVPRSFGPGVCSRTCSWGMCRQCPGFKTSFAYSFRIPYSHAHDLHGGGGRSHRLRGRRAAAAPARASQTSRSARSPRGPAPGPRLGEHQPHLAPLADRVVADTTPETLAGHDVVFLALPHGQSAAIADAAGTGHPDRRLRRRLPARRRRRPGRSSTAPPHAGTWPYGLPELPGARAALTGAKRVAVPGLLPDRLHAGARPGRRRRAGRARTWSWSPRPGPPAPASP